MYNNQYRNQTLETAQLTNPNQNTMNLNPQPPQMGQPYYPNPQLPQMGQPYNSNPQFPQTNQPNSYPPQVSQPYMQSNPNMQAIPVYNAPITVNPKISPNIEISPNTQVNVEPKINITATEKVRKKYTPPPKFGPDSVTMLCPECNERISTETEKKYNIKAILTAIATFYVGLVAIQLCNNKGIGCEDCEHSCPKCGTRLGAYYAM